MAWLSSRPDRMRIGTEVQVRRDADDLDAVQVGQAEVEHDQVGVRVGGRLQGAAAAARGHDLVVAGLQVDPQRPQDLRLVVDDQDAGHAGSC